MLTSTPHSPDLNPLDFFLWGYVKSKVYEKKPKSIEELKMKITETINAIPIDLCMNVCDNFVERIFRCKDIEGSYHEGITIK